MMTQKEQVLKAIENMGNEIKFRTNKNYWAFEDHGRVKGEQAKLEIARKLYLAVKAATNLVPILNSYINKLGPEGNMLRCIVGVIEGSTKNWQLTDSGLTFVENR